MSAGDNIDDIIIVTAPLPNVLITQAQPTAIGVKGEKGDPGEAGPTGPVGPAGKDGVDGLNGLNGVDGLNGRDGVDGRVGDVGPAGADGAKGDRGADGVAGAKGDRGEPGSDGERGVDGQTGSKGDTGAVGPIGPVGPQGDRGLTGADGSQGVAGANGRDGRDGFQGPTGSKGDQGETGAKGDRGTDGVAGTKGADGATGATGAAGADGLPGAKGDKGDKGDTGLQGIQGIQGVKGDTGATGAKGDTGATGATGSASNGLPTGGTSGQILTKTASTDFTSAWQTKTFLAVAGSGRELQYKNGNALAAASKVSVHTDGNLIFGGDSVVRSANIAGRSFISASDSYSLATENPLGISPAFSTQREWQAHGDTLNISSKAWDATYTGTATPVQMASGAALNEPQISYETAASAGSVAGMVCANPVIKNTADNISGFFVTLRLRIPAWTAGQRWFVGLTTDGSAPTDVDPSTLTNFIGFGVNSADTSLQYMTRATGALTKTDIVMPPALSGNFYTFMFHLPSVAGNINAIVRNGPYNMGNATTSLPAGRYYLKAYMSTGATTTKAAISFSRGYIEHVYSVY
ncbi:collagen-like protein [Sphingomonas sp. CFBP 13706]|uniref:collagen-like protein n=1 Tax=Sphingomonas sp. CFBP 13706 TaxID=2775314 RepID=UPI00177B81D4|nr:collagen-like protein [Sphingomonas sp. CFBP 13706]MBD8734880.1 collagen-like protein [Sphingomonas sp. CFBP 13706]